MAYLRIGLLLCGFCGSASLSAQIRLPDTLATLDAAIQYLEKEHDLLFSFRDEDVVGRAVQIPARTLPLDALLTALFESASLDFERLDERYIVLRPRPTVLELRGRITDAATRQGLAYASIHTPDGRHGTTADSTGFFRLQLTNVADSLIVAYLGYRDTLLTSVDFSGNAPLQIGLHVRTTLMRDFTLTEYLTEAITLDETGAAIVVASPVTDVLPGRADLVQALRFLPGVSLPTGSESSLSIRGGTAGQNLVQWEGIPHYHTGHYFGLIPAYNPLVVDRMRVYRGGFPAEYGGRVSGLVALSTEADPEQGAQWAASQDFLHSNIAVRTPLFDQRAALTGGVRRSSADWWRSPTYQQLSRRVQQGELLQTPVRERLPAGLRIADRVDYYDTHWKLAYHPSERDEWTGAFTGLADNFSSTLTADGPGRSRTDTIALRQYGGRVGWARRWNERWSTEADWVGSYFDQTYGYRLEAPRADRPDERGRKDNTVVESQLNLRTRLRQTNGEWQFGYQARRTRLDYAFTQDAEQGRTSDRLDMTTQWIHAPYASYRYQTDRWGYRAGVRLPYNVSAGRLSVSPRLRVWVPTQHGQVHLFAGRIYQFVNRLVEFGGEQASIALPLWIGTRLPDVPVLRSDQFSAGYRYARHRWRVEVEAYTKRIEGQSSLATGFAEDLSKGFLIGEARVFGVETLLRKKWTNWDAWVSHTYTQSTYRFAAFFDPSFPAPNLRPHVLDAATIFRRGPWHVSTGLQWASGLPFNRLQDFGLRELDDGRTILVPRTQAFNAARLNPTLRLDTGVGYQLTLPRLTGNLQFTCYNVLNRVNFYEQSLFVARTEAMGERLDYLRRSDVGVLPNVRLLLRWK